MDKLLLFPNAVAHDPAIDAWFTAPDHELRRMVRPWFERLRRCGPDVRELVQDGRPTACVGEAPFAYVDGFTAHAAVGFFYGAELGDPAGLLEGAGKRMRHVKLRWGVAVEEASLGAMIDEAYADILRRLRHTC